MSQAEGCLCLGLSEEKRNGTQPVEETGVGSASTDRVDSAFVSVLLCFHHLLPGCEPGVNAWCHLRQTEFLSLESLLAGEGEETINKPPHLKLQIVCVTYGVRKVL